jgi:enediyne biosynthesis protein E4
MFAAASCFLVMVSAAQRSQPANSASITPTFRDVSRAAGIDFVHSNGATAEKYLPETMGSGGLFFDYDNDGWIDVLLLDGGSIGSAEAGRQAHHRLYRNRGNGSFEDVTAKSGIAHGGYGMGACAADYDNDGSVDVYITNVGPNVLYRNTGHGTFEDVTKIAGVGSPLWSTSCAFADFDRDGYVDLFVTNYVDAGITNNKYCGDPGRHLRVYCHPLTYQPLPNVLYHNNGNGTFTDITSQAGIARYKGNGLGVTVADYDDDGWPDVFVANDSVPNFLFHNEGKGVFREVGLLAGVAVATDGKARAGMGTDFGDYDGDGRLDLIVTNHEFEGATLFRNLGQGLFGEATVASGIGPPTLPWVGFGTVLFDYDNDGRLDLAVVNGHVVDNTASFRAGSTYTQPRLLFRNTGMGRFEDVSRISGPAFAVERVGRTLVAGDIDNDGDLDLLVTNTGQAAEVLRNDGGNRGHALLVRLVGQSSNRDGIGARLRLMTGQTTQVREVKAGSSYLGQNDLRQHFGMGAADVAGRLEVRWPSGRTDVAERVPADSIVTVVEGMGVTKRVPIRGQGSGIWDQGPWIR